MFCNKWDGDKFLDPMIDVI
jgi:hypothetical protein